jgi:hypothetical protein
MPQYPKIPNIPCLITYEPGEMVNTRCGYCGTPYTYIVPQPGESSKTKCPKIVNKGEKQCNTVWIHYSSEKNFVQYIQELSKGE